MKPAITIALYCICCLFSGCNYVSQTIDYANFHQNNIISAHQCAFIPGVNLLILVCDSAQLSLQRNQKGVHFVDTDLQLSESAKKMLGVASR